VNAFIRANLLVLFFSLSSSSLAFGANKDISANIPEQLGWTPNKHYVCGGYYQDPLADLLDKPLPPLNTTTAVIDADTSILHVDGPSYLYGNVTITQPGRFARADQAEIRRDPTTKQISDSTLTGNVVLREPGQMVVGDKAHMEMQNKSIDFFHALYQMLVSRFNPNATGPADAKQSLHAWGHVAELHRLSASMTHLIKATYTTCSPTTNTWQLSASRVNLNHDTGRGYAYNMWLKVYKVPVLYTPYFDFPIDDRRQTGFLFPAMSSSSESGMGIIIPYYLNLAPNYDATITPVLFSKRGAQLNTLFRYLTTDSSGFFNGGYLPGDRAFASFKNQALNDYPAGPQLTHLENLSNNRDFFTWQDSRRYDPHWSSTVNYNYLSDDYYYQDFATPSSTAPNQFLRQGTVNYAGNNWNFTGELLGYQTLHPINLAAVNNPYNRLPELDWNGNFPNQDYGFNYQLNNQLVYFQRDRNLIESATLGPSNEPPNATRINVQPGISWPYTSLGGYLTPQLQVALTHYDIGNQVSGYANSAQRNIPIFNIDSGLYFDRDMTLGSTDYQQTLEPRLFYLYVPYRNQTSLPLFDTSLIPFSYDSMFATNRFSGIDRIGDADQITFALTTRLLDANTGAEKFRFSIGEIYYFRNRVVTTCTPNGTPGAASSNTVCTSTDPNIVLGATSLTDKTSPIAAQASYQINSAWNTTGSIAWDPNVHQTVNANWNFQYQPAPNHIFNATYNFIRLGDPTGNPNISPSSSQNDLNQVGFSFAWPLSMRWSVIGALNYNRSHQYPQTYFYGLQYDSCCWAVRLVQGQTFMALNQNYNPVFNHAVYLQWQLKGLGSAGSDPSSLILPNIPGYIDSFQTSSTMPRLAS
jgi:LPS-assembly protein